MSAPAVRPPLFDRLDAGSPTTTDGDWWVVPIGGGVTHWCPTCGAGKVDELLDAGAWTVEAHDAGYEVADARGTVHVAATCEVCGVTS